jgi:hypothetical protein
MGVVKRMLLASISVDGVKFDDEIMAIVPAALGSHAARHPTIVTSVVGSTNMMITAFL